MRKQKQIKVGKIIKEFRKKNRYTQKELAEKIGVTTRYISDIEQDRSRASYDVLVNICNLFEISLDEIFAEYLKIKQNKELQYSIEGAIDYLKRIKT